MLPGGRSENKRLLAQAIIANDGTGTDSRGNYFANLFLTRDKVWKTVRIKDFPRKSYNVWKLLQRVLKEIK